MRKGIAPIRRLFCHWETPEGFKKLAERTELGIQPRTVLLQSEVLSDGNGDWFNLMHVYRIIKGEHPHWQVFVWAHFKGREAPTFDITEFGLEEANYLATDDKTQQRLIQKLASREPVLKEDDLEAQQIMRWHSLSELIIHVSYAHFGKKSYADDVGDTELASAFGKSPFSTIYFREYGGSTNGPAYSEKTCIQLNHGSRHPDTINMGVRPFEGGVFAINPKVCAKFTDKRLNDFVKEHPNFYLNYGADLSGFCRQIDCLNHEPEETVDVVVSKTTNPEIIKKCVQEAQNLQSYSSIIFAHMDENGKFVFGKEQTINKPPLFSKRTLQVIDLFPLPHDDMIYLMNMAKEPVGITGNVSFSEVVGLNKLLYYNNRDCLASFWNGVYELTKENFPDSKELIQYLECQQFPEPTYLKYKKTSAPPAKVAVPFKLTKENLTLVSQQWKAVRDFIVEHKNVKSTILGAIYWQLMRQEFIEHPKLQELFKTHTDPVWSYQQEKDFEAKVTLICADITQVTSADKDGAIAAEGAVQA